MAAAVEFAPEVFEGERYCGSLAAEREWAGVLALKAAGIEVEEVKVAAIIENAFDDHMTALTENIATDDEFNEELVFGTPKIRKIVDGKVVSKIGRPLYDVVEKGARHSANLAESDTTFQHQADRDEGDRLYMEVVDSLKVGEVAHTVSMDPKEWYATDPTLCDSIGYRKGMAVQHVAYKLDEQTMLMWTYAIKQADKKTISQIYSEKFGVKIDPSTHSDMWIRHIHRAKMPRAWAEQIGNTTLQRHKELTGRENRYYSVDSFMIENTDDVRELFDAYMPRIVNAVRSKKNDPELQNFAAHIIGHTADKLKPEARRLLIRVANKANFDDDDARLMKIMVRFATIEKLRTKIPDYKKRLDQEAERRGITIIPHEVVVNYFFDPRIVEVDRQRMHELSVMMAQDIAVGVRANRSSGGCSPIDLARDDNGMPRINGVFNDLFARAENMQEQEHVRMGKDGKGPLDFKCRNGHDNTREDFKPLEETCRVCGDEVSCKPEEKPQKQPTKVVTLFAKKQSNERAKIAA